MLKITDHDYSLVDGFTDIALIHSFIPVFSFWIGKNLQEIRMKHNLQEIR